MMTLTDRKAINNATLTGFGNESRIDYSDYQEAGIGESRQSFSDYQSYTKPYNGLSSMVQNSSIIKNQINSSNSRPITQHQALQNVNNTTVSSWGKTNTVQPSYDNSFENNSRIYNADKIAGIAPAPSKFVTDLQSQPQWKPNDITSSLYQQPLDSSKIPLNAENAVKNISLPKDINPIQFETIKTPTKADLQINNTPPKASVKTGGGLNKIGSIAGKALGIAQGVMGGISLVNQISEGSKARINPEEMLMKYGTSNSNIGDGISYERQNNIDVNSEMDQVKAETNQAALGTAMTGMSAGGAIGSVLGPVGGAVGAVAGGLIGGIAGLFGGKSRRKAEEERLRRANEMAVAKTNQNRSIAFTEKIRKKVNQKYGNQEDELLYAQEGVENVGNLFSRTSKKDSIDTAFGKILGEPNAMTSKGELIVHEKSNNGYNKNFNVHEVKRGPNDTAPSYLADNDTVIAEPLADIAKEAIRRDRQGIGNNEFEKVKIMQRNLRDSGILAMLNRMPRRTTGDLKRTQRQQLPGYFLGKDWLGKAKNTLKTIGNEVYNSIPAITGIGIGLQQYNQAANQDIYKPYSFKSNEYKGALNELDKLHINQFPVTNEIRNAQARTDRAITQSGGLSTGQRATNTIAAAFNTQNAIANALTKLQEINNNYRAQAAQARLNVGEQEAQRKQQAMQWDADTYAKGHAARLQGMQMGLYNIQNALEQHLANTDKRNQFKKIMNMYNQELGLKKEELQKMYEKNNVPESIRKPEEYPAYHVFLPETTIKPQQLQEPASKETFTVPSVNLRYGMRNNADVKNLQNALNYIYRKDSSFKPLKPDGSFGPLTKSAVKRFQMDNFANNSNWHTGFYGANTRGKLAEILKSLGGI